MKGHAPAAERNRTPILEALKPRLPETPGTLLEIASGTGQHAVYFASNLPGWKIQPTDKQPESISSIDMWREDEGAESVLPALMLDVLAEPWPVESADAIFCANMIHISPWSCTEALFRGAARLLKSGQKLFTYGPYLVDARPTTNSNQAFDQDLRGRDPKWGLRDIAEVEGVAKGAGFTLKERLDMPAHNFFVVFERD